MNFKPTRLKTFVSIILPIFWYIGLLLELQLTCSSIKLSYYCRDAGFNLLPNCSNCPTSLGNFFGSLLIILLPGIILYIIWSLFDKKRLNNNINNSFSREVKVHPRQNIPEIKKKHIKHNVRRK
jgi:hypothetical protein